VHVLENGSCAVKVDAVKALLQFLAETTPTLQPLAKPTGNPEALYNAVANSVLRVVARRFESTPAD
jgi:hypothetical protein